MEKVKKTHNFSKILKFSKPHWKLSLLAPLLVLVEVAAELAQPELMSEIVNKGVIGGDHDVILSTGIKMFVITFFGMIGGVLSIYSAGKVSYTFGADMRQALFRKIAYLSFSNIDKLQTGSLITRLTGDVSKIQHVIQASMRLLFRAPFLFIGAIIMVLSMNKGIVSILLVMLPILLFCIITILKLSYPYFLITQEKTDRLNTILQETLAGARVIKAYVREDSEKERFKVANDDLINTTLKANKITILMMPILSLTINIGIIFVIWIGGIKVGLGQMNVGEIMACINYLAQILMSLMMASRVIMSITEARASMTRIEEVLQIEDKESESDGDSDIEDFESLTFNHVSFKYETPNNIASEAKNEDDEDIHDDGYVLKDISFTLNNGETLAIIGGTGSGKTTLINLIPRYYEVSDGSIQINGKNIKEYKIKQLRSKIGMVMQKSTLFSGSIADNLRWGKNDATEQEIVDASQKAQIYDFVQTLDEKFDYVLGQGANNVSGGQKQRLCIARTLVKKPQIIILDDSLSAVDFRTEAQLRHTLKETKATKIIIAQRIGSIKEADKILLLDDGKMVGFGTHNELLANNQIYQEIYNSQVS
ncbi:MAG TPA: ABC transporter ATP-binding protein [Paludibacteraceae bacterium]|nr:ABC transporter ATP-binding protein [Paludibacteraceae bacterium]HOU69168.1 ABC transporter ATP-binding protein [Paludibacteraceae bacterium]HQF50951.1 ABC transporter ATP-binding protein [Paludibacteraceae bacterium]